MTNTLIIIDEDVGLVARREPSFLPAWGFGDDTRPSVSNPAPHREMCGSQPCSGLLPQTPPGQSVDKTRGSFPRRAWAGAVRCVRWFETSWIGDLLGAISLFAMLFGGLWAGYVMGVQ